MGKSVTLRIRESIWFGRAITQPLTTERDIQLPAGGTFDLAFHSEKHRCIITHIDAQWVEITPLRPSSSAPAPALVDEIGGIGPGRMASPTRLAAGQSLKLSTWILDAGAIWEISVLKIGT